MKAGLHLALASSMCFLLFSMFPDGPSFSWKRTSLDVKKKKKEGGAG